MTCYRPQPAVQSLKNGGWSQPKIIYPSSWDYSDGSRIFVPSHYYFDKAVAANRSISLPCGLCFGCRLSNARDWSLRMMHETRYHDQNWFITLTYSDDHVTPDYDLDYRDLDTFFKRARHSFQRTSRPFKYFACGEYGDKNLRPHYHFAGFDFNLDDLRFFKKSPSGGSYFISSSLTDCWGKGHVIVAPLEYDSAAYIARYVTKKMNGRNVRYKDYFDPETGEVFQYTIERSFQSKGLGLKFYQQHHKEIWDLDGCLYNNKYLVKPPRYYMKQLEKVDPDRALAIKEARRADFHDYKLDNAKDKELLYQMQARRLQMQTLVREL